MLCKSHAPEPLDSKTAALLYNTDQYSMTQ